MEGKSFYRCVWCGHELEALYIQYSPGNIRLIKCEICKKVADEYIECEFMIPLIDLTLHNPKAYRHVLYNKLTQQFQTLKILWWTLSLAFLLSDAMRSFFWRNKASNSGSYHGLSSTVFLFRKVMWDVILGNLMFVCVLSLGAICFMRHAISRWREILLAIQISSFFKIFYVSMTIWEFPAPVLIVIDLFLLSSNSVAVQVMTMEKSAKCTIVCLFAHLAKLLYIHFLN